MGVVSCPRCQIALRKARLGLICRQCDGCWFTFEQLDKALAASDEDLEGWGLKATLAPDKGSSEETPLISCPICLEKLRRFPYLVDSGVMVDVCSKHGMWLDDGELTAIRSYCKYAGVTLEAPKPKSFFRKLFSKFG